MNPAMNFLKFLFTPTLKSIPPRREIDQRAIVARLTQGNVRLQLGKYVTAEELEERAKRAYAPRPISD